jgi:hypothetical protein
MSPQTTNRRKQLDKLEPTDRQFYDYIVDHLKREHGLANNRMSWMLTSQAFLFAAYGVINTRSVSPQSDSLQANLLNLKPDPVQADLLHAINLALPSVGITVSIAALLGILGTNMAVRYYRREWDSMPNVVWQRFPLPSGAKIPHAIGLFSTLIIPLIISFAWLLVVCKRESHIWVFRMAMAAIVILIGYLYLDARKMKSPAHKKSPDYG